MPRPIRPSRKTWGVGVGREEEEDLEGKLGEETVLGKETWSTSETRIGWDKGIEGSTKSETGSKAKEEGKEEEIEGEGEGERELGIIIQ